MIYITGDTHRRFGGIYGFCNKHKTSKEDVIIILGDVGINYMLDESDYSIKKHIAKFPITLFCVHGNHEERPFNVEGYIEQNWHEGTVYVDPEFPNQIFAKDGEIYNLNGKRVLVLGGAYSVDKYYRLACGWHWFESEQPNDEIKKYVEENLEKNNWEVDIVLSHTCPYDFMPRHLFLSSIDQNEVDYTTELWLQKIESNLKYDKWYFGHYHDNYKQGNVIMLYEDILEFE